MRTVRWQRFRLSRAWRALLVCAVALAVGVGGVAVAAARTVGSQSSSGDFAIAIANGTASHPSRIRVQVVASPNQQVSGNWEVICERGFGAGSKSGSFDGRTPLTRTLPFPMSRPDSCTFSAEASLANSGHITVRLLSP